MPTALPHSIWKPLPRLPLGGRGRNSHAVFNLWILEFSKCTGIPFVALLSHHSVACMKFTYY